MQFFCIAVATMPLGIWSMLRDEARHLRSAPEMSLFDRKYLGSTELCSLGNVHVTLNGDLNIREMRLGGTGTHFVQSMVACDGPPDDSCWDKAKGCDLNPTRCPCKFHMPRLPPLDFEYRYIAKKVLQASSDSTGNSTGSPKVMLIGLGGGMLPQYFLEHGDSALTVDAVELSGDVVSAARAFFGVGQAEASGRLRVIQGDGNAVMKNTKPETYSTAVVDCFGEGRVPTGCRSSEFVGSLYQSLRPGGTLLQNVVTGNMDHPEQDEEIKRELNDLLSVYRSNFGQDNVELAAHMVHADNAVIHAWKGQ